LFFWLHPSVVLETVVGKLNISLFPATYKVFPADAKVGDKFAHLSEDILD
jgi:hypothetical protein